MKDKKLQKKLFKITLGVGLFALLLAFVALGLHFYNTYTKTVKNVKAEDVLKKAADQLDSLAASEQDWNLAMELSVTYDGETAKSESTLDGNLKIKDEDIYMELTQKNTSQVNDEDAETTETTVKSYTEKVDGSWKNYSTTDDETWYYSTPEEADADVVAAEQKLLAAIHELNMDWTLSEKTKRVNKKHAYVCTADVPADVALKMLALFDMEAVFEEGEEAYLTDKTVEISYAIYEKSGQPAEISISFAELYQAIWDEMKAEEGDGTTEEIAVDGFEATIIFTSYEVKEDLSAPEEVREGAIDSSAGEWTEPEDSEWYDYFTNNLGADLAGKYGITEENYGNVTEEEWESIYFKEIGY
ncbi:MAG: hypothetical protein E7269_06400 [Lachnospiraceae bacterium]|nr:hypothetical protein [Lachnospiraceae bacterium]